MISTSKEASEHLLASQNTHQLISIINVIKHDFHEINPKHVHAFYSQDLHARNMCMLFRSPLILNKS